MPVFTYKATDSRGQITSGRIEAVSRAQAAGMVQAQSLIPLSIHEIGADEEAAAARDVGAFFDRVRIRQVIDFTTEVSALLDAGIPLEQALTIEAEQCEHPGLQKLVRQVVEDVRAGLAFSEALARHGNVFPRLYVTMVRAGEEAGAMETVMRRLASYLEKSGEMRQKVMGAVAYPILLVALGAIALVVLFTYLIPRFTSIFASHKAALPFMTRTLFIVSDLVVGYWWVAVLLVGLLVVAQRMLVREEEGRLRWDAWLLRIPLMGTLLVKSEVARITRMLSTLLDGGVPVLISLHATRLTVQNTVLAGVMQDVLESVQGGAPMARPMGESGVFPPMVVRMISIGEESGRLEQMLIKIADRYEKETERLIEVMTTMLGPLLIVGIGVIVAFVYIGLISGIFAINSLAG